MATPIDGLIPFHSQKELRAFIMITDIGVRVNDVFDFINVRAASWVETAKFMAFYRLF